MFQPTDHLEPIKSLIEYMVKSIKQEHAVEWSTIPKAQVFKLTLAGADGSIIERIVTIDHIGTDGIFAIRYLAALKMPLYYVISSKLDHLSWDAGYTYRRIENELMLFLQQVISDEHVAEMVTHLTTRDDINKEFRGSGALVELYNQGNFKRPEWRFKLVSTNDETVYVDSLAPTKADWHTYRMFYLGIVAANKRGISFAITHTAETMAERVVLDSFRSSGLSYDDMPQVVSNSLRNR